MILMSCTIDYLTLFFFSFLWWVDRNVLLCKCVHGWFARCERDNIVINLVQKRALNYIVICNCDNLLDKCFTCCCCCCASVTQFLIGVVGVPFVWKSWEICHDFCWREYKQVCGCEKFPARKFFGRKFNAVLQQSYFKMEKSAPAMNFYTIWIEKWFFHGMKLMFEITHVHFFNTSLVCNRFENF